MPAAMTPELRAVLFDKDGTLVDFQATWVPAYWSAALKLTQGDRALTRELLEATGLRSGPPDRILPDTPLACGTTGEVVAAWADHLGRPALATLGRHLLAEHTRTPTAVNGLDLVLGRLHRQGFELGVATMDGTQEARDGLQALGVLELMGFVVGFDAGVGVKPGPGMVEAFAAAAGVSCAEIVVVGDSVRDMRMAQAAGAGLAVGVLTGPASRTHLEPHADVVIDSIAQLHEVLGC